MTPDQFDAFMGRVDALREKAPQLADFDLTDEDREILAAVPAEIMAELEMALAAYTPQSEDIRTPFALKALATYMRALPDLARAVNIGEEMALAAEGAA